MQGPHFVPRGYLLHLFVIVLFLRGMHTHSPMFERYQNTEGFPPTPKVYEYEYHGQEYEEQGLFKVWLREWYFSIPRILAEFIPFNKWVPLLSPVVCSVFPSTHALCRPPG